MFNYNKLTVLQYLSRIHHKQLSLEMIAKAIRNGRLGDNLFRDVYSEARNPNTSDERKKEIHNKLSPHFAISRKFKPGKYFVGDIDYEPTGYFLVCISKEDNPLLFSEFEITNNLFDYLIKLSFVALAFSTTDNDTIKLIIKTYPCSSEVYKEFYYGLYVFFGSRKIIISENSADDKLFCRLEFDSKVYLNNNPTIFKQRIESIEILKPSVEVKAVSEIDPEIVNNIDVINVIEFIENNKINIISNYNVWLILSFALATKGENGRKLLHRLSSLHPNYNRDIIDAQFDICLGNHSIDITLFSFVYVCQIAGINQHLKMEVLNGDI